MGEHRLRELEFLSKTDLMDAKGRSYNYWSDGTIRDIAEDAPNAENAVRSNVITRTKVISVK